jgi:proline iminopeptidase
VLAFLLGRAPQWLLVTPAMLLGNLVGLMLAIRFGVSRPRLGFAGALGIGVLSIAVAVLGVAVSRPATTAPILGADGQVVPGSIAELTTAAIGGHDQALMIRGRSTSLPVLLHLAGGPGGTDVGAMRLDTGLEERFVVATWDQRGTGKSYRAFEPAETLTLEQVVADTIEVSEYLRDRFGRERIYITGQSWGSIPATLAVQRRPELYHALVTTGQMVSVRETDRLFYDDTLAWARERGDAQLVGRLESLGPPPYAELVGSYPVIVGAERALNPYPEFDGRTEMTATIWGPEFDLMEKVGAMRGLVDVYATLYPQLQDLDFRRDVPWLDVPVWLAMGRHEARGRVEPARAWFEALEAPAKRWVVLDGSSHRANFERPAEYARLLDEVVADVRERESGATAGRLGFIRSIGLAAGWLEFDGAEWLTGAAAAEAAAADGVVAPGTSDMPSGFYLRNHDPVTVRLALSPNATVELVSIQTDDGALERPFGLEELAAAWEEPEGDVWLRALRDAPYHLTIVDSVVTEIREQYVP